MYGTSQENMFKMQTSKFYKYRQRFKIVLMLNSGCPSNSMVEKCRRIEEGRIDQGVKDLATLLFYNFLKESVGKHLHSTVPRRHFERLS